MIEKIIISIFGLILLFAIPIVLIRIFAIKRMKKIERDKAELYASYRGDTEIRVKTGNLMEKNYIVTSFAIYKTDSYSLTLL